jgi:hypothetical protein
VEPGILFGYLLKPFYEIKPENPVVEPAKIGPQNLKKLDRDFTTEIIKNTLTKIRNKYSAYDAIVVERWTHFINNKKEMGVS